MQSLPAIVYMRLSHDLAVISGAHTLLYAEDADAARAFFRDVLGFPNVDNGGGWLIFALPPSELGVHPAAGSSGRRGMHELSFMCHDIRATVAQLEARGVEFVGDISDEGYGLVTMFKVPGFGELQLYEPRHKSPLTEFS
jgi:catechol 2,3-dioxygenase-like lactoylglutathione lyase family enzyme